MKPRSSISYHSLWSTRGSSNRSPVESTTRLPNEICLLVAGYAADEQKAPVKEKKKSSNNPSWVETLGFLSFIGVMFGFPVSSTLSSHYSHRM